MYCFHQVIQDQLHISMSLWSSLTVKGGATVRQKLQMYSWTGSGDCNQSCMVEPVSGNVST